ncbi:MAG: cytochrome bc complex cytochrome b subunit [Nitrososphaerales archaeon]|nr:cytochrome bc complex cytochrome b subunit [Nitrososphaerales archaeon]
MAGESQESASLAEGNEEPKPGKLERLARWFDTRLGLSYELFRPAPQYSINPFYWLGALAVVAFVIQGVTGIMMMLYYVPSPSLAYPSTLYIFQKVSYGTFLQTVHLYTAYAMIMLAFMHLMRGYFVSVHKKPREAMWVVGMLMGFITLGFGFTGYLLPWTIVSKSATDVGLGMVQALPPPVSSFLTFLIVGVGGDAAELLRFYDLHVVVLPAALLLLLGAKMYMLETHGVAEPATGTPGRIPPAKLGPIPIFPDVSFYLFELAALFGAAMLLISVAFPLTLQPEYSAALAGQYTAQPDWYFLWVYQILKISAFEEAGLPVALSVITLIFIVLLLLPFIDRGKTRAIAGRTKYVTLGAIFVAEVAVLAIWGFVTPGKVIPDEQALVILGGTALLVTLGSAVTYRILFRPLNRQGASLPFTPGGPATQASSPRVSIRSASIWTAGVFVALLAVGTFSMGAAFNALAGLVVAGPLPSGLSTLAVALSGICASAVGSAYLLYRLDLPNGRIRRRVRAFEVGWAG